MSAKIGFAGREPKVTRWSKPLAPERRAEMIRLWASGVHPDVVARIFDVHPAYVRKAAARAGIKSVFRPGHRPKGATA